jgi:hypothetical protein
MPTAIVAFHRVPGNESGLSCKCFPPGDVDPIAYNDLRPKLVGDRQHRFQALSFEI